MIGSTRYVARMQIAQQSRLSGEIAKLQMSISTNQRLSVASEDPNAAARVGDIRQLQAYHAVWSRNADTGAAISSAADTALGSVQSLLNRAKEVALQGRNDTNADLDRAVLARELRGLADDSEGYAATTDPQGHALFPAVAPTPIPVGEGQALAATDTAANVFGTVATAEGPRSIAEILRRAADALETGPAGIAKLDANGNPAVDANGDPVMLTRGEAITESIAAIDTAATHIDGVRTDQGLRGQRFDQAKATLIASDTDLAAERSGLEDTDLTYAIGEFQTKQLALEAAQNVFAKTHRTSLFDLLG